MSAPAETIRTPVEGEPELHPPVSGYGDEPIASIPATESYDGVPVTVVKAGFIHYVFLSRLWPGEYAGLVSAESVTPAIFSIEEKKRGWVIVRGESEGIGWLSVVAEDFRGRRYRASVPVHVRSGLPRVRAGLKSDRLDRKRNGLSVPRRLRLRPTSRQHRR